MKQLLLLLIVVLISSGAVIAADSGPITMRTGQNITLSSTSYINVGSNNYTLSTDRINQSQGFTGLGASTMAGAFDFNGYNITDAKFGPSQSTARVGTYAWCDFVTDGTGDEVQVNAALAVYDSVEIVSDLNVDNSIDIPANKTLFSRTRSNVITLDNDFSDTRVITSTGNYVTIDGIAIDGNKANNNLACFGIYIMHNYPRVTNCLLMNIPNRGIVITGDNAIIDGCDVLETGLTTQDFNYGIELHGSNDSVIRNCYVDGVLWFNTNSGGFGIFAEDCLRCNIVDSTITNTSDYIYMENFDYGVVSGNTVNINPTYNTSGGLKVGIDVGNSACEYTTVSNNVVSGAGTFGFYDQGAHYCNWIGNIAIGQTYGIYHKIVANNGIQNIVHAGNVLIGASATTGAGIQISGSSGYTGNRNIVISGNSISTFKYGLLAGTSAGGEMKGISIVGNTFIDCDTYYVNTYTSATNCTVSGNTVYSSGTYTMSGTNSITSNQAWS